MATLHRLFVDTAPGSDAPFAAALKNITERRSVLPKRLVPPGPTSGQLDLLFQLAAAAPDHGCLTPWRFVVVPLSGRYRQERQFRTSCSAHARWDSTADS